MLKKCNTELAIAAIWLPSSSPDPIDQVLLKACLLKLKVDSEVFALATLQILAVPVAFGMTAVRATQAIPIRIDLTLA